MGAQRSTSLSKKTGNKLHRQSLYVKQKQDREKEKRETRFRRKKEEEREPELRRERIARNIPATIDRKRVWDDVDDDGLGASVDMEQLLKKRRLQQEEAEEKLAAEAENGDESEEEEGDEADSMLGSDDEEESDEEVAAKVRAKQVIRDDSMAPSTTSTNLDLTPESLVAKFPSLFSDDGPAEPQVLVTTTLNSTIHDEAKLLCTLFPHSTYIPRSAHKYGYKYSVREICKFAGNRGFSTVMIVREDQKKPVGLDIVHLPSGPTFHFSISNWVEGKKLPGHGNPTNHYPELLLNNFKTPLGVLTARLFQSLWPKTPELQGRQVVTLHNQRDYIFLRRHRYIFRDKRATEKSVVGADGKELKGVENIRTGLQELGPRATLKLRRIDKGIGRAGSEGDDAVQWEWKAKMEKQRTRFNL
ncbi:Brix-domain-containing protein [Annulohypoxylon maeteangense]|uniref:Brix-domain-containing protein n=1 Tax=Annulohypoxylon maeteangense TaxID=1927788 RepID=UPI002008E871|nr:Brix-domain-containing protein [Annulohypoxylon maeteangense]KAI0887425.1 Brix-domain-containing protein [Annulohypoxylon maeteangense]